MQGVARRSWRQMDRPGERWGWRELPRCGSPGGTHGPPPPSGHDPKRSQQQGRRRNPARSPARAGERARCDHRRRTPPRLPPAAPTQHSPPSHRRCPQRQSRRAPRSPSWQRSSRPPTRRSAVHDRSPDRDRPPRPAARPRAAHPPLRLRRSPAASSTSTTSGTAKVRSVASRSFQARVASCSGARSASCGRSSSSLARRSTRAVATARSISASRETARQGDRRRGRDGRRHAERIVGKPSRPVECISRTDHDREERRGDAGGLSQTGGEIGDRARRLDQAAEPGDIDRRARDDAGEAGGELAQVDGTAAGRLEPARESFEVAVGQRLAERRVHRRGELVAERQELGTLSRAARRECPRQQRKRLADREPRCGTGQRAVEAGERCDPLGSRAAPRRADRASVAAATRSIAAGSDGGSWSERGDRRALAAVARLPRPSARSTPSRTRRDRRRPAVAR